MQTRFFPKLLLFLLCLVGSLSWSQTSKTLVWQGNQLYDNATLAKIIEVNWQKYLATQELSYVDDAAYQLLSHYRRHGHYFASVDYETSDGQVIFIIHEYQPVVVKRVQIVSALDSKRSLSFSDERLRKFLTPPPLTGQAYFNKAQTLDDKSAIENFYLSQGYLQASAQLHYRFLPPPPDSKEVEVVIAVTEGLCFFLDEVEFSGNHRYSAQRLREVVKFNSSMLYTPRLHQELSDALRNFYREEGYARVSVKPLIQELEATKTATRQGRRITFKLDEGQQHYIRDIAISGNEITANSVILRQMDTETGDRYQLSKISSSKQNLSDTRLFIWMDIEEKFVGEDQVDLAITVQERTTQSITLHLGYATTYGVSGGFAYEHANLWGSFRQLLFTGESSLFSAELVKREAILQLTDPQFLSSRTWSGQLRSFVLYEETPTFTVLERGGGVTFEHRFSRELSMQLGYSAIWSQILEIQEGEDSQEEGTTFLSVLQEKFILNLRDDNGYPTSGCYNFVEFEESLTALFAEIDYFKAYGHSAWYFRLIGRCVLSVAIRGGVITPFGDSDKIPIQKRYFSGGVDSVRSFKTKELPPLNDKNNPVGGEGIFLLSAELRIPLFSNLGVSLFGDSGQIIPEIRKISDYRISHLKYALGYSVWYNTPIGPIRFDMGFNPDRAENPLSGKKEALFAWFISIGFSF